MAAAHVEAPPSPPPYGCIEAAPGYTLTLDPPPSTRKPTSKHQPTPRSLSLLSQPVKFTFGPHGTISPTSAPFATHFRLALAPSSAASSLSSLSSLSSQIENSTFRLHLHKTEAPRAEHDEVLCPPRGVPIFELRPLPSSDGLTTAAAVKIAGLPRGTIYAGTLRQKKRARTPAVFKRRRSSTSSNSSSNPEDDAQAVWEYLVLDRPVFRFANGTWKNLAGKVVAFEGPRLDGDGTMAAGVEQLVVAEKVEEKMVDLLVAVHAARLWTSGRMWADRGA